MLRTGPRRRKPAAGRDGSAGNAPAENPWTVVVSVEHGGNHVPAEYRPLFRSHGDLLRSHRGWDPGALDLARRLASMLAAPLIASTVTRLLVDLNRSPHNPRVFSQITRRLPRREREDLLVRFHRSHREAVSAAVADGVRRGFRVLHLAVHSFTPVLNGVTRTPDLALLYDPGRPLERELARLWTVELARAEPARAVRRNVPYRGNADGLTTSLRGLHSPQRYVGIEIEVNQRLIQRSGHFPRWVSVVLCETVPAAIMGLPLVR